MTSRVWSHATEEAEEGWSLQWAMTSPLYINLSDRMRPCLKNIYIKYKSKKQNITNMAINILPPGSVWENDLGDLGFHREAKFSFSFFFQFSFKIFLKLISYSSCVYPQVLNNLIQKSSKTEILSP